MENLAINMERTEMIQKLDKANKLRIEGNELMEIPITSETKKGSTVKAQLTWKRGLLENEQKRQQKRTK